MRGLHAVAGWRSWCTSRCLPPPSEHHRGLVARTVAASHSKEGGATEGDIRAGEPRRRRASAGEHRSIQTERRLRALQPRRPTLAPASPLAHWLCARWWAAPWRTRCAGCAWCRRALPISTALSDGCRSARLGAAAAPARPELSLWCDAARRLGIRCDVGRDRDGRNLNRAARPVRLRRCDTEVSPAPVRSVATEHAVLRSEDRDAGCAASSSLRTYCRLPADAALAPLGPRTSSLQLRALG